jgi:hypothetical protein
MPTLVYRSCWSKIQPLHYSDDTIDPFVNKLVDKIFKIKSNRIIVYPNGKKYYQPSEEYKRYVISIKRNVLRRL